MYLRIKKDSVTSILLFIFSVFLLERGIHSVPLKKIFRLLEPFQKSETSIRMGLSRGVQNGLFVNEKQGQEVYYRLTDKAMQSFEYWQNTLARFQDRINMQQADWDRTWSIVLLVLPPRNAANTEQFTDSLERLGYGILSKGQWISPYDFSGDVIKLADEHGLKKQLVIFSGNLQNKKPQTIAFEVWPVGEIAKRYNKYFHQMLEATGALNTQSDTGGILTFLYLYGSKLFEIIQDDPQLPLQILPPEWPGPKVVQAFWEIRGQALPGANDFIADIIDDRGEK